MSSRPPHGLAGSTRASQGYQCLAEFSKAEQAMQSSPVPSNAWQGLVVLGRSRQDLAELAWPCQCSAGLGSVWQGSAGRGK
eukprot:8310201-Pyramimonas_sp.AAC.1